MMVCGAAKGLMPNSIRKNDRHCAIGCSRVTLANITEALRIHCILLSQVNAFGVLCG